MRSASIIMPIHSDPLFEVRRRLINEVAAQSGWRLVVPEYDPIAPEFDADRAAAVLSRVSLVIADLSHERPSCYFELGFAQALRIPFEIVAQQGSEIHQTGGRNRVIIYSGHDGFREALLLALEKHKGT